MKQSETTAIVDSPLALINGEAMVEAPRGLYMPNPNMRILLSTFEGPLDLLLHLIRKRVINVLELSIAEIAEQYMKYVDMFRKYNLEFLSEYLAMAAWLTEKKSQSLLPQSREQEEEDNDPRAELMQTLREYQRFKTASEKLDSLCREERDITIIALYAPQPNELPASPDVELDALAAAMLAALKRRSIQAPYRIKNVTFSTSERMSFILALLETKNVGRIGDCCEPSEGAGGLIAALLGILELTKSHLITTEQENAYATIHFYLNRD